MGLLIGWVVASIAIGLVARARRDAFWPAFAYALVLSPLVGFALTMLKLPDRPKAGPVVVTLQRTGAIRPRRIVMEARGSEKRLPVC